MISTLKSLFLTLIVLDLGCIKTLLKKKGGLLAGCRFLEKFHVYAHTLVIISFQVYSKQQAHSFDVIPLNFLNYPSVASKCIRIFSSLHSFLPPLQNNLVSFVLLPLLFLKCLAAYLDLSHLTFSPIKSQIPIP